MKFDSGAIKRFLEQKEIEQELERTRRRLGTKRSVFVSYSSIDKRVALKLAKLLRELEVDYFLDVKDIKVGDKVVEGVSAALRSCSHLLVVISPASLKSQWVLFEIGQATALDLVILPFLTHSSLEPPDFIRKYHYTTKVAEIRDYFQTPDIDQEELERLYRIIMSRLPDRSHYEFDQEKSSKEKRVWRSVRGDVAEAAGDLIEISLKKTNQTVRIKHYRSWGGGIIDSSSITFSPEHDRIEAYDVNQPLGWGKKTRTDTRSWSAGESFWKAMIAKLRKDLEDPEDGT